MKRLLPILVLLAATIAAACAAKHGAVGDATPAATGSPPPISVAAASATLTAPPATPVAPPMPAAALLWSTDPPEDLDKTKVDTRDGTLKKTPAQVDDGMSQQASWFPYEIDYYKITRTDLETTLAPYVGRPIRIEGVYHKTWKQDDGSWNYEVDPLKITLLK